MSTTISNINCVTSFLDKNNIEYSVDTNPSDEKINRIKASIARKAKIYKKTIENYRLSIQN